jgi:hypothetical protein
MPDRKGFLFFHRVNRDGTHDSICCGCYLTIGTTDVESSLESQEDAHVCDPLQQYMASQYAYHAIERVDRAITERHIRHTQSQN